jgi:hypothetical protein
MSRSALRSQLYRAARDLGNAIKCDAYACHTEWAYLDDLSPWEVRANHAELGWRTVGRDPVLDNCPKHFQSAPRQGGESAR